MLLMHFAVRWVGESELRSEPLSAGFAIPSCLVILLLLTLLQ